MFKKLYKFVKEMSSGVPPTGPALPVVPIPKFDHKDQEIKNRAKALADSMGSRYCCSESDTFPAEQYAIPKNILKRN